MGCPLFEGGPTLNLRGDGIVDDRELFDMVDEVIEQHDGSVKLSLKNVMGYEYYPSLATYWMERLGREGVCQKEERGEDIIK